MNQHEQQAIYRAAIEQLKAERAAQRREEFLTAPTQKAA
jgi:hypothetical protein